MSMREEFEAWLLEVHGLTSEWSEERNCFKDYPAHLAYEAWRASRDALVVDIGEGTPAKEFREGAQVISIAEAILRIEAAGVQVKP